MAGQYRVSIVKGPPKHSRSEQKFPRGPIRFVLSMKEKASRRWVKRCRLFAALAVFTYSFGSGLLHARGIDSINPEKNQTNKRSKVKEREKGKDQQDDIVDYDYELFVSVSTSLSSGSLNKADEEAEKINSQVIGVKLQAGFLFGDNFEPVIEVHQSQRTSKIGDYESKSSSLNWGVGALFNVPMGKAVDPARTGANSPVLSNSDWIPYGGFILTSVGSSDTDGNTATSEVKNSGMSTRLIFGSRYMIYPHLAVNFWIRLSYDKKDTSATETSTTGGSVSKLSVDANLFSFSIFI